MNLQYHLHESETASALQAILNQWLSAGWELHGPTLVTPTGFAQAMVGPVRGIGISPHTQQGDNVSSHGQPATPEHEAMQNHSYKDAIESGNVYKRQKLSSPEVISLDEALEQYGFQKEEMLVLEFEGIQACPVWQFTPHIQPHMRQLNQLLDECWTLYLFLTQTKAYLNDRTPVQALNENDCACVFKLAKGYWD